MLIMIYYYMALGILTSIAFFLDKRFAEFDMRRIPEKWLHSLEALGGCFGALLAAQLFKHKRQKQSYMLVLYGITVLHFMIWIVYFIKS